jgi:hypothetical protein
VEKMNLDLKFNYSEALKWSNLSQGQVDLLRESVKNSVLVPKTLTNKQVNIA